MTTDGTLGDFVRPDLRPRSEAPPWQGGAVVEWRKETKVESCFIRSSQKEAVWSGK